MIQNEYSMKNNRWPTDTVTVPLTFRSSPRKELSNEDFPDPTEPTTATKLPGLIPTVMLEKTAKRMVIYYIHTYKQYKNFRTKDRCQ